jgi:hypothetical protein
VGAAVNKEEVTKSYINIKGKPRLNLEVGSKPLNAKR